MALCVVCFIVLAVRRLLSARTIGGPANHATDCPDSSSRRASDVFGNSSLLNLCAPLGLFYVFYVAVYRMSNLMRLRMVLMLVLNQLFD